VIGEQRAGGGRTRPRDVLGGTAALAIRSLLAGARGRSSSEPSDRGRRLLLVQIDGLSRARLERALTAGHLPALAARLAAGQHALSSLRSGAPASTPAFQAGLFYGVAPSVPGFVWYDRRTGREVRMDRPADVAEVETRIAAGAPSPLLRGGTSYFSIFSGGAALPCFCLSGLEGDLALECCEPDVAVRDALASALARSLAAARSAMRLANELGAGVVDGVRWSLALGRTKHEARFFAHRVVVHGLRELAVQALLLDVSRGVPAVYVDFLGFDDCAHRRGPDSQAAVRNLASIDAALATILRATEAVPELGYDVYVLSDHGHVPTVPFESVSGVPLPEYVAAAERGEPLTRAVPRLGPPAGVSTGRGTLSARRTGRVATAEGGDLAHVYFLDEPAPLPIDGIRARHRRVLAALSAERGVGLLALRGGRRGFALVRGEALDLADPRATARLPHPQPRLLATYLADLLSLPESGDLVVLGWRGENRPVVAYAWEFGSHGGVAPEETEAFVVYPAGRPHAFDRMLRPSELYRYFEEGYRTREKRRGSAAPGVRHERASDRGVAREAPGT
jgi:hypothetical protein